MYDASFLFHFIVYEFYSRVRIYQYVMRDREDAYQLIG